MDLQKTIEHLCSKGHRGSTTQKEEWAAGEIVTTFTSFGLKTELQRFASHRTYGERLAIHLVPALLLSVLAPFHSDLVIPILVLIGFLIVSFTIENLFLFDVTSRLIPLKRSVNVLAHQPHEGASRRIVLTAHHDSQKEGQIFNPKLIELMQGRFSVNSRITPIHLTFLGIVGLFCTSGGFILKLDGDLASVHALLHWLLLIWTTFATGLVLQWTLNTRYVPGANDNATGVAVMLSLAEDISAMESSRIPPSEIEYYFLSTGCEETGMGGALAFICDNREFLDEKPTSIVCLDGFGTGDLRYLIRDGMLMTKPYDQFLINVARKTTLERYGEERPFISRIFTDGFAFATRGYQAITFGCLPEDLTLANYHWRTDTPENVNMDTVHGARDFLREYVAILSGEDWPVRIDGSR
jgi:hypothetical protein